MITQSFYRQIMKALSNITNATISFLTGLKGERKAINKSVIHDYTQRLISSNLNMFRKLETKI